MCLLVGVSIQDPRLTLEVIESHVTNVLSNIGEETFASVEVVLLLVIYLGDNNFEKVSRNMCNNE